MFAQPLLLLGIIFQPAIPRGEAKFRLLAGERALSVLGFSRASAETNPAQSCPGALLWLKERKSPIPVSLPRMPRWNKPGLHGKTAEGRGRVVFTWESKFSTAHEEQSAWKKPREAGNLCFGVLHTPSHSYAYGEVKFGILTICTWRSLCQEWGQGQ